mgnify:CR=1 FL=1
MRKILMAGLLMLSGFGVARPSEGVDEILKLAAAGVGEEILLAFVETSPVAYRLSADEIIQLKDLGLPQTVIAAMLTRGSELRKNAPDANPAIATPAPLPESEGEIAARSVAPEQTAPTTPSPAPASDPAIQSSLAQPAAQPIATGMQPVYTYQPPVYSTPTASTVILDTAPVVAPPPDRYTTTFFYDALSPYGTWVSDPAYGWVWEPAAIRLNPRWRPYCDGGYWVWTDCGWYWQSDYSWGWAPFHYGRWVFIRHRWCWIPGHRWAPAWVYWRSYDEGYGWAPLPPGSDFDIRLGFTFHGKNVDFSFGFNLRDSDYVFVPRHRFLDRRLYTHVLPQHQVTNIFNRTTVINNTYVYNDNRIINNGVPVSSLAEVVKQPIQPVKIEDARLKPGDRIQGNRRDGDRIVAFRPEIKDQVTELPPEVQQRRLASIPPTKRIVLAPPKDIGKKGLIPSTLPEIPASATPPATLVPGTSPEPSPGDRPGRKPPAVTTPALPDPAKPPATLVPGTSPEPSPSDRPGRKPPGGEQKTDERLKAEEESRIKAAEAEAARKAHLEAARKLQQNLEAARLQAEAEAKAQRDAALEAAKRKAQMDAETLKAQREAVLEAARQKAKADADAIKARRDAVEQAQREAFQRTEQEAAKRKAAEEAIRVQQAQMEAARRAQMEAARQKAQTEAPRTGEQAPVQRRIEGPATRQPGPFPVPVTPPLPPSEQPAPQSVDQRAQ